MMASIGRIFSTGIPTLDEKFGKKGWHIGDWVGFVGEPGSMKTVTCMKVAIEWLNNNEGYCVIYVTTETNQTAVVQQFLDFGFDLTDYIESGQFVAVDLFSIPGLLGKKTADMELSRKVIEATRTMEPFKKEYDGKILLIIDSLAPLWQIMPSMSRTMFTTISHMLRKVVDLCVVTLQLSVGTQKGFGFGAEHGIDVMIRFGSYYTNGERGWIHVSKCRGDWCDKRLFDYSITSDKNLLVGNPINIEGRFRDVYEAVESMKYTATREVNTERNELLRQQNKLLESQNEILSAMTAMMEKNKHDEEIKAILDEPV